MIAIVCPDCFEQNGKTVELLLDTEADVPVMMFMSMVFTASCPECHESYELPFECTDKDDIFSVEDDVNTQIH